MRLRSVLPRAWQTIYLAHDGSSVRQAPSLDRSAHALDDVRAACRHDHEWVADLWCLRAFRRARWSVLRECIRGSWLSEVEPAGRLARGRAELALHADVAAHRRRRVVPVVPGGERRMAVALVPAARYSWRDRDAEILPAAAQGAPAAGKTQTPPESRVHVHHPARCAVGRDRICDLQAHAALVAHRAVRRISSGALLALLGGVDLHRLSRRPRRAGVRRRSGVAPSHDLWLVSRPLPQP